MSGSSCLILNIHDPVFWLMVLNVKAHGINEGFCPLYTPVFPR
jgi:hypothetical protein